ncbi:hypothetical protein ARMGADRAFT_1040625 [Armillaria gallica]|uniref:Uncharacterized protein n=1 Tax=Armillaria gallica TaxID=47427 RepID=A0A2H3CWJ2_ARMGA|nr:hypothetical protein ARMGADRAFT_1040625 [Armillaria gallica]
MAKQIVEFRFLHLDELIDVAEEEGLTEENQCGTLLGGTAEGEGWLGYSGWTSGDAARRRARHGNTVKVAQDIRLCAHPRTHPAAISVPNTSSMLPKVGRPTFLRNAGKDRSRARPYDGTVPIHTVTQAPSEDR